MVKVHLSAVVQIGKTGNADHHGGHNYQERDEPVAELHGVQHDLRLDLQNLRQLLRLGNALRENQLLIVVVTPEFGFDGVFHGQSQVDGQGEEKSQHRQGDGPGPALNVLPEQLKK